MANEWEHIAKLRQLMAPAAALPWLHCGIGDDTAILRLPANLAERIPSESSIAGDILVTADMLLEGVHFDLRHATPEQVGRKAMNVNISDIAAMAGKPLAAVVTVALPRRAEEIEADGQTRSLADRLAEGLQAAAARFGVVIVGGDTNTSPGPLVVSVTLIGEATGRGAVRRSGARPGDALCVTGSLGYSLAGRHLDFVPRVDAALRLQERCELHAMIDLSDGLASDLLHLARESQCGAIVDAAAIPIAPYDDPYGVYAADARSPLEHALGDGEDFELLFTLPAPEADSLVREQPLAEVGGPTIHRIGTITVEQTVLLREGDQRRPMPSGGFAHQW